MMLVQPGEVLQVCWIVSKEDKMAEWVYVENNEIKEYHGELPRSWRNVSGLNLASTEELVSLGWYPVRKIQTSYDSSLYYEAGYSYEIKDDHVTETINIQAYPEEHVLRMQEMKISNFYKNVREERNQKLAECDWTQAIDIQELKTQEWKDAWKAYRQILRDYPETISYGEVNWPLKPE